jgi:hypothetical protein
VFGDRLGRVLTWTSVGQETRDVIVGLSSAGSLLVVVFVERRRNGRELRVPIAWFPRLEAGSAAARANLRIIEDGRAINWPDLDEDLGVAPLLDAGAPG